MKARVINLLQKALKEKKIKLKIEEIEKLIEVPPSQEMGDYAFPCFFLSEKLKQDPHQIALEVREKIREFPLTDFDDIQTAGPYVNFFIDRKNLARKVIWEAITQKKNYGRKDVGKKRKIIFDISHPNIAKPFGVGHLRSTIIGNALANICEFQGFKPVKINYIGDWGAQFGKVLFGFVKFGNENKLHKDPIKHLLDVYVKANKKIYEKQSRDWFKKLEQRDRKALMLWKVFKELSLTEFEEIYKILGVKFDVYTSESEAVNDSKKIIEELKTKKLLKKSEGAQIIDLEKYNLGVCIIEKSDGTTTYALRDIVSAIKRYKQYKFANMIYEVGQEQKLYFKQTFKILELMGYTWAKDCVHVDHGLYLDKDGKKFATRKGKTVFMRDILDKTILLAQKEIKKREPKISKEELEKRALKIAIAAIFYGDLKNNRSNNVIFDIKRFVSFEGDTGPYILYSYARASSILRKTTNQDKFKVSELEPKEFDLVKKLSQFSDVVGSAFKHWNPSLIANYSYQLAQIFNEFYHECPVIGSKQEAFRLALVEAFRQTLKNALDLLGIKTLNRM